MSTESLELSSEVSTVKNTHTVTLNETGMQSHTQELHKAAVSGKYTFMFPQEAQKVREQHLSEKKVQVAMTNVFMLCFVLQSQHPLS
eukprot:625045-Pelagomonas_calceolata.AAC.1